MPWNLNLLIFVVVLCCIFIFPSESQTNSPASLPTEVPSALPTIAPTDPTAAPSSSPSPSPTSAPSRLPTAVPTSAPSASLNDLAPAQAICYDPNVEAMLTIVKKKVDDTTTPDETSSLKDKWNNLSTGQKAVVGVTAGVLAAPVAAYAGACAIGLSSVGPVAGGWFAANMGVGLAAGSAMSALQSAVMTGSIYGYAAAAGGTVGLATAATAAATSDGKEAAPTPADAATDQPPADPPMPGNSKDDHMSDR